MQKNTNKEIIPAIPPLRGIGSLWNAWGLEKSTSKRALLFNWLKYLLTIKKIKKVIKAKIDKKLSSIESVCILSFYTFIIFFNNINTQYYYNQWN